MSNNELDTITISVGAPLREAAHSSWRDFVGIAASIACAIHCAVMPIAIGYLPLLGIEFLADQSFHQWMVLICFGIALAAFIPGWRKHGRILPATVATAGLCIITATAFLCADDCCANREQGNSASVVAGPTTTACDEACCAHLPDEATAPMKPKDASTASIMTIPFLTSYASWLTPLGGLLLVGAHLVNHRFNCRCGCCSSVSSFRDNNEST